MGYSTDLLGMLELKPVLTPEQVQYLNTLFGTRRMKRDVNKLMEIYKGKHGNPFAKEQTPEAIYGREGEYFAMDDGQSGQMTDDSILDYNTPPCQAGYMNTSKDGVPGLWCNWCITEDGEFLIWDGGEKFYKYVEWLRYIIKHFFIPWGINAVGNIQWYGEDREDIGKIKVRDNEVFVFAGHITYEEEE